MGTTDRDTLLEQFCTIVPGLQRELAVFFLEANAWSLQVTEHFSFDIVDGTTIVLYFALILGGCCELFGLWNECRAANTHRVSRNG
jgi:hypothetical protein